MKIQIAQDCHTPEIRRMWEYCFDDGDTFVNWFFNKVYKSENTIAAFDGDKVAANLQLFFYDILVGGQKCRAGYIAGVASLPEYRGRGYVKALMNAAIEALYRRGAVYSLLIPFRFDFYRSFGFEACYWLSEYAGGMSSLKPFAKARGSFHEYSDAPIEIYNEYVKGKNGHIVRDKEVFDEIYDETKNGGGHFYVLDAGGYIIYTIRDDVFYALEIAYTGEKQLASLLGFIYSHSSQVSNFKIRCADDGHLRQILCEIDIKETRKPHIAARVLNVKKALELTNTLPDKKAIISVLDEVISENTSFEIADNRVTPSQNGIKLDVGTFTRLAMGAISPAEAENMGLIENAKDFEGIFKKEINYANMLGWV